MITDTEALRREFEAWFADGYPRAVEREGQGQYKLMAAHSAWVAFQAGHAAGTAPMSPVTRAEIAACLRALSRRMIACGTAMDVYGSETMQAHGLELIGAAGIAAGWADGIEGELP